MVSTHIPKVCPLRSVADPLARFLVGRNPLLQGSMVGQSGLPEQKIQLSDLLVIRAKEVLVRAKHILTRLLHFDIALDAFFGNVADCANGISYAPQTRKSGTQLRKLLTQPPRSVSLELVCKALWRFGRVTFDKQANVVRHDFKRLNRYFQFLSLLIKQGAQFLGNLTHQHLAPILRTPDQMIFQGVNASCIAAMPRIVHRTRVLKHPIFVKHVSERRAGLPLPPKGSSSRQ
jgi:hypothetical protein